MKIGAMIMVALMTININCSSKKNGVKMEALPQIENVKWHITAVKQYIPSQILDGRMPHFTLNKNDGRVSGNAGCNSFGGEYKLQGNSITFSKMFGTEMACATGMDIEQAVYSTLNGKVFFAGTNNMAFITDSLGNKLMTLEPAVK